MRPLYKISNFCLDNWAIILDTPDDIAYLYRLAQESPLLYAESACKRKPNGLQEYVDAMNEFN